MPYGNLTINQITDEQLIKVIQIKEKSAGKMTIGSVGQPAPIGNGPNTGYNNIQVSFNDAAGAKFVAEVAAMLET